MLFRPFSSDDIFISYSRKDGALYAAGLADELTVKGFSCFIDKLGTEPNSDLPESLKRKIRHCSVFVLLATEKAAASEFVENEIKEFLKTKRTIIPIDFDGAIERARWYSLIPGLAAESEKNKTALMTGDPSPSSIGWIEKSFNYTRRNERMRRVFWLTSLFFLLLIGASVVAGYVAKINIAAAQEAKRTADEATKLANDKIKEAADATKLAQDKTREAADASNLAREKGQEAANATAKAEQQTQLAQQAKNEAIEATSQAVKAKAEAQEQQKIAHARRIANQAERSRGNTAGTLIKSTVRSIQSLRESPTIEGGQALVNSLALLPHPKSPFVYHDVSSSALSPGANHLAIVKSNHKVDIMRVDGQAVAQNVQSAGAFVAISNDGKHLASSNGKIVNVQQIATSWSKNIEVLLSNDESIRAIALSPDGKYLAIGIRDSDDEYTASGEELDYRAEVLSVESGDEILDLKVKRSQETVWAINFSPNGEFLTIGGAYRTPKERQIGYVRTWEIKTFLKEENEKLTAKDFLEGPAFYQDSPVTALAHSSREENFATASGKNIWVWKVSDRRDFQQIARVPNERSVNELAFSSDGESLSVLFSAERDEDSTSHKQNVIGQEWGLDSGLEASQVPPLTQLSDAAFISDEQMVGLMGDGIEYNLQAIDLKNRKSSPSTLIGGIKLLPFSEDSKLSNDGKYLAVLRSNTTEVWDITNPHRNWVIPNPTAQPDNMSLSPDGKSVALSNFYGSDKPEIVDVYILGSDNKYEVLGRVECKGPIRSMALGAGGDYLITTHHQDADMGDVAQVWDVRRNIEITPPSLKSVKGIELIETSPKGTYLLTANLEGNTQLWELGSNRMILTLQYSQVVEGAAFSLDERYLATESDGDLRVWELASGLEVVTLGLDKNSRVLGFSPDGKYLATYSTELHLWYLFAEDWIEEACKRLPQDDSYKSVCTKEPQ